MDQSLIGATLHTKRHLIRTVIHVFTHPSIMTVQNGGPVQMMRSVQRQSAILSVKYKLLILKSQTVLSFPVWIHETARLKTGTAPTPDISCANSSISML